ncbi:reverse transcriptase domain-containing protein, partial [Enterococcus faecalis]
SQKKQAIEQLNPNHYSPKAVKRIYITKFGKKEKRPLGIPCMLDRAMQALYLQALEPVSECTSDSNSYGFRRFKSAKDAGEKVFKVLCRQYSAQWILEGDIKGCFDNISHQWLID